MKNQFKIDTDEGFDDVIDRNYLNGSLEEIMAYYTKNVVLYY